MKIKCPNCLIQDSIPAGQRKLRTHGSFWRKSDGRRVTRFWCSTCNKTFSRATLNPCFRQKKRNKNVLVARLLTGGMSQREIARVLRLNRKTVVRKFLFMAAKARQELSDFNQRQPLATEVEFDDLETFEHTKCKPLSVTLMVEFKTRRILGFEVSSMPAKGKLAAISRKKYGYRPDHRTLGRQKLFRSTSQLISPMAKLRSDSNPHYPADVAKFFPKCRHETVLARAGAITGQGELKKVKWDPIFSLNHTCAMLRANVNRLIRKTWCTTKRPDRLANHLALYAWSHNRQISTA